MENYEIIRPDGQATGYCSLVATDEDSKRKLFNATATPQETVSDHINEIIDIQHVFVEPVQIVDENTGEVSDAPRIVLISPDGTGYQAVSKGIFNAVRRIISIFGEPGQWERPLRVKIKQIKKGAYNILTLELV